MGQPEEKSSVIYAIVFGIIGGIVVIAGIVFCVKKFALREKKDTSKRGGGYKYAARSAQHI